MAACCLYSLGTLCAGLGTTAWRLEDILGRLAIVTMLLCPRRYFNAGPCELRLGVYESFDTLCIYLESDSLAGDPERNFWVKYRCAAQVVQYCDPPLHSIFGHVLCHHLVRNS